jgi:HAD superfamily hydrolase (TIGR01549 family)
VSRAALFDLDNTLIDRQALFRTWAQWFVTAKGLPPGDVEWLVTADLDGYASREELFAGLRARRQLAEDLDTLVSNYLRDYPTFLEPDPAVRGELERLRSDGWRIAIVTNGPATQHAKVAAAGLGDLVDACLVSAEVGSWKPDAQIFQAAAAACGVDDRRVETVWMVGDSPEHDMVGAHSLGMRTVWMHRDRQWSVGDFRPDHHAGSIPDAVDILLASGSPDPG